MIPSLCAYLRAANLVYYLTGFAVVVSLFYLVLFCFETADLNLV